MLNQREIILSELGSLARSMFGEGGGAVYLYGSQARNDATPNSDWDILVITDDSIITADDFRHYAFPFAEIGWRHGMQITPVHYTRSQWEAQRDTAFYHTVQADAIRL